MNTITKEELLARKYDCLTMKDLRRFIKENEDISDSTPVLTERIEDVYFDGREWSGSKINGWNVYLVEGYNYWNASQFNDSMREEIKNRNLGKGEYSEKLNPSEAIVELTDDLKEQFFTAHCISKDKDGEVVLIYNHY